MSRNPGPSRHTRIIAYAYGGARRDVPMRLYEIEPEVWINLDFVVEVMYELRARPIHAKISTIPEHHLTIVMVKGKDFELTDAEAIMSFTQAIGLPGFALGESDETDTP